MKSMPHFRFATLALPLHTQQAHGGGSRWHYVGDNFPGSTITAWNGPSLTGD